MGIQSKTKKISRIPRKLFKALVQDMRYLLYENANFKPTVLQFPINDICNSRCIMCNIWKNKYTYQITPSELDRIFQDPLFKAIRYVGLSGGEPTLRSDLPEISCVIVNNLKKLKGAGIITNGLQSSKALQRILDTDNVFRKEEIPFNVTVSLDGIGKIHDKNRGIPGNFESAIQLINSLKYHNIPVSVGCTITPINCYWIDDVYEWAKKHDIPANFHIAVDIDRIYNNGYSEKFAFSAEQKLHIALFFDYLSEEMDISEGRRFIYSQMSEQLTEKTARGYRCDYWNKGVTLDSYGNISYCSVKSPLFENALNTSASDLFYEHLYEREAIRREHCDRCFHHASPEIPLNSLIEIYSKKVSNHFCSQQKRVPKFNINKTSQVKPYQWEKVLITGWYGTETAGDKAILGELVNYLHNRNPECEIAITSINPKVSLQTNNEIEGLLNAEIIPLNSAMKRNVINKVDAVIIGGGPLMEINEMRSIHKIFGEASHQRKARVIFGCGIGPLYSREKRQLTNEILRLATAGFFRDNESLIYAQECNQTSPFVLGCDPAIGYLKRKKEALALLKPKNSLVTLLRAQTPLYNKNVDLQKTIDYQISKTIDILTNKLSEPTVLMSMHTLRQGNDDRLYNRRIFSMLENSDRVAIERNYLSLDETIQKISENKVALVMRYHGHLFALGLGIPFVSIDYTGPNGKVRNLMNRIQYSNHSLLWDGYKSESACDTFENILIDYEARKISIMRKNKMLLNDLHKAYRCLD